MLLIFFNISARTQIQQQNNMQLNWFQHVRSYFSPVLLETATSAIHPLLQLHLVSGRLQLSTATAVYSYGDYYTPIVAGFDKVAPLISKTGSLLVLGYGVGSVPVFLNKKYPEYSLQLTGVEYDAVIYEWAKRYSPNYEPGAISLIQADATEFVANCQHAYDLIFVDLFQEQTVANHFQTIKFMESCKKLLLPNGILLYNIIPLATTDLSAEFGNHFKAVFTKNELLHLNKNELWIGYR